MRVFVSRLVTADLSGAGATGSDLTGLLPHGNNTPRGQRRSHQKTLIRRSALKVLKRDGFAALGVSAVARQAKLGKPLIYRYFGGFTGLVKAVASTPEFWPPVEEIVKPPAARVTTSYGHVVGGAVVRLLQALRARPVTCEFWAWELVERNALTQVVDAALAQLGRATVTQARQHALPPENIDAAAQNVLLLAGILLPRHS